MGIFLIRELILEQKTYPYIYDTNKLCPYWEMCAWLYTYVHGCACTYRHDFVENTGWQSVTSSTSLSLSTLVLRHSFPLNVDNIDFAELAAQQAPKICLSLTPPKSTHLWPLALGLQTHHCVWLLCRCWGIPTQLLLLEQKSFYSQSDLPNPTLVFAAEALADVQLTK